MKYLIEDTNEIVEERKLRELLYDYEVNDLKDNWKDYLDKNFYVKTQCDNIQTAVDGDMEEVISMLREKWTVPVKKLELNKYTAIIIIKTDTTLEKFVEIQNKTKEFMAEIKKENIIGKKKLAYDIAKQNEGYFIEYNFETPQEKIADLERYFRLEDNILKFMVVKESE